MNTCTRFLRARLARVVIGAFICVAVTSIAANAQLTGDSVDLRRDDPAIQGGAFGSVNGQNGSAQDGNTIVLLRGEGSKQPEIELYDGAVEPPKLANRFGLDSLDPHLYSIDDNRLFLHDKNGSLHVYDVTDPTNPLLVGRRDTDAVVNGEPLRYGNTFVQVFVGDTTGSVIERVDMSQPSNPVVTQLVMPERIVPLYVDSQAVVAIDFKGNGYLFDADSAGFSLKGTFPSFKRFDARKGEVGYTHDGMVLDLTNPLAPNTIRKIDSNTAAASIAVFGNRLYMIDGKDVNAGADSLPVWKLNVYELDNPLRPRNISRTGGLYFSIPMAADSTTVMLTELVPDNRNPGMTKYQHPVRIMYTAPNAQKTSVGVGPIAPRSVTVNEARLDVASVEGLFRYNLDSLANPPRTIAGAQFEGMRRIAFFDTVAFAVDDANQLLAINTASPNSPVVASRTSGVTGDVLEAIGSTVFVGMDRRTITAIDFTNLGQGVALDTLLPMGQANVVHMNVDPATRRAAVAYSGASTFGVRLYDVGNPAQMSMLAEIDGSRTRRTMAVILSGNRMYAAANDVTDTTRWYVQSYDISNPAQPTLVDEVTGTGRAFDLGLLDTVLVGTMPGGSLHVFFVQPDGKLRTGPVAHSEASSDLRIRRTPNGEYQIVAVAGGRADVDGKMHEGAGGLLFFRLKRVSISSVDAPHGRAAAITMSEAYPNPCTATTSFAFTLRDAAHATLSLLDMNGRRVRIALDRHLDTGDHVCLVDLAGLPQGRYVAELRAGGRTSQRMLTVVR